jgi:hypothetical protein
VRLHGVDFSGGGGGGRGKIRAVARDLDRPRAPLRDLGRLDRAGLRSLILDAADDGPSLWRIDAPASVPIEVAEAHGVGDTWLEIARWMRGYEDARAWRTALRAKSRREPRRRCDRAFATPMAPMNLRVFKQTWTFVCEILLPLAESGRVRIEPVHPGNAATTVVEGCPAAVLASKGWPRRGYKGRGDGPREVREEILRLVGEAGVVVGSEMADEAVADGEGDLLDAVLLATEPWSGPVPASASIEAWVY